MPYQVMISYKSGPTSKLARDLRQRLAAAGDDIMPFLDQEDITPSDRWRRSLEHQLSTCHAAVVLLCEGALKSQWVRYEVDALWRRWYATDIDPNAPDVPLIIQPIGDLDNAKLAAQLETVDLGQIHLAPTAASASDVDAEALVKQLVEHARRGLADLGIVERKMAKHLEVCHDNDLTDMTDASVGHLAGTPAERVVTRLTSPDTDIETSLRVQRSLADRTRDAQAAEELGLCAEASMMSLLSPEGVQSLQAAADGEDANRTQVLVSDSCNKAMIQIWFERAKLEQGMAGRSFELANRWYLAHVDLEPPADPANRVTDLAAQLIKQVLSADGLEEAAFTTARTMQRHILIVVPSEGNPDLSEEVLNKVFSDPRFECVVIAIAPKHMSPGELQQVFPAAAYAGANPAPVGDVWVEHDRTLTSVAGLYESHCDVLRGAA